MIILTAAGTASARGPHALDGESNLIPVAGTLLAIDAASGQGKELFHVDHLSLGPPVMVGDVIYVASSGKTLFALDRHGGEKKWTFTAEHMLSGVIATPNAVFVGVGGTETALDAASGKVLWTYENDLAITEPALVDGAVVFNSIDGPIAIEQATGKLRWKLAVQWGYFVFSPLTDRRLCVWKTDEIYVIDTERGKTLWQSTADIHTTAARSRFHPRRWGSRRSDLPIARGAPKDARDWSLHAMEADSGRVLWKTNLGDHFQRWLPHPHRLGLDILRAGRQSARPEPHHRRQKVGGRDQARGIKRGLDARHSAGPLHP